MRSLLPPYWSASALSQFLRCGAQYLFARIEGLDPEAESTNFVLGSALHHAHAFVRTKQKRCESVLLDDAKQVFVDSFDVLGSNPVVKFEDGEAAGLREDGLRYVELLVANLGQEEVVAVEQEFEVPFVDFVTGEQLERPLRGVFDLVLRDDKGLIVVDLKTAAVRYSADRVATDLHATAYSYAASRLYPAGARFRWDVILKQRKPSFERVHATRDATSFARMIALVRSVERAIAAGAFIPADGSWSCSGCGYRSACAKWAEHRLDFVDQPVAKVPA